jgi:NAD(P)-dependent dehydrogenase (short-subunit alcohol dehydrogenase family)
MRVETLASFAWEEARDLVAVDLLAPLRLQDLFAKGALARGGGGFVVNVSSMAGRIPLKGCAYYGAAKAGLAMASEVARVELAAHGIRVVTVCPGPVRSPLEEAARAGYGGGGAVGELLPLGSPEGLAACVVDAVLANRAHVVYPRAYAAGLMAPALSSWAVNALAPDPARGIRSPPARR